MLAIDVTRHSIAKYRVVVNQCGDGERVSIKRHTTIKINNHITNDCKNDRKEEPRKKRVEAMNLLIFVDFRCR